MTDKIVVFSTCGSEQEARKLGRHLVTRRVAACVAITPGVWSVYRWKGEIEEAQEWGLTIKTRRHLFAQLCDELRLMHTYETPEILALPVVDGSRDYLEWIDVETGGLQDG